MSFLIRGVIPLEMVERLGIMINEEDADYDLLNASGDPMDVLGTVVVCLEPEVEDTREVLGIVTRDLGDDEILLSFSDMLDWGLLSDEFPNVKQKIMKTKKVNTPKTKMKKRKPVKKMPKSNPATMGGDSGIFCGVSPRSGEETSGSTKQKEDITAKEVEEYFKSTFKDVFREKLEEGSIDKIVAKLASSQVSG